MRLFLLGVLLALGCARGVSAQSIRVDSMYDYADRYWRARMVIASATHDSVAITCSAGASGTWSADARFMAAVPWSPDAIMSSTQSIYGYTTASASSRLLVVWPDGMRDRWEIAFAPSRESVSVGTVVTSSAPSVGDARSGWLKNGDGFVQRLATQGRVALTYPIDGWVRSLEIALSVEQRESVRAMRTRCTTPYEGTRAR